MNVARRFVRALSYFTILPVPSVETSPEPGDVAMLPIVGAVIGAVAGTIALGASRALSPRVAAATAFALPIVLTGALHLDGFLDICDAAFASVDVEKRREILRDPRHGSFAFAGGAIVAVANYAALREIDPQDWPSALALSESVARYAALVVARTQERTTEAGTASRAFSIRTDDRTLVIEGALLLTYAHWYGGFRVAARTAGVIAATVPTARLLAERFGTALSGDGYGFTITCANVATLCACASP